MADTVADAAAGRIADQAPRQGAAPAGGGRVKLYKFVRSPIGLGMRRIGMAPWIENGLGN